MQLGRSQGSGKPKGSTSHALFLPGLLPLLEKQTDRGDLMRARVLAILRLALLRVLVNEVSASKALLESGQQDAKDSFSRGV